MKTLTVRLPEALVADIESESRERKLSKSDVVRERLTRPRGARRASESFEAIAHLAGSVTGLPADLSSRMREALAATGYGKNRRRG
jgi:Arc/MetJ-type ribon-helix-helix transcriptional regulator